MTNTDIWKAIEAALAAKGASPEWIAYVMPALHVEMTRFGNHEFHRGYVACENGEGCGAYDPPRVGEEKDDRAFADRETGDIVRMVEASMTERDSGDDLLDGFGPAEGLLGGNA